MPQIGIRITHELHGRIQDTADEQNTSISDFVRHAVEHVLNGCQPPLNIAQHEKLTQCLQQQVQEKDAQISQLHQLMAMDRSEREQLTQQLDRVHLQLEDSRKRRTIWQRVKAVFVAEPG